MKARPHPVLLLAIGTLFLVASCADPDDPTTPAPPDPAATTVLDLDASGGSYLVSAPDGAELLIDIPAGAVTDPVTVALTPVTPLGDGLARFRFEPSGVALLAPATITVRPPEGIDIPANAVFFLAFDERVSLLAHRRRRERGTATATSRPSAPPIPADKSFDGAGWLQLDYQLCLLDLQFAVEKFVQVKNDNWFPAPTRECIDTIEALKEECQNEQHDALRQQITQEACQENADARLLAYNQPLDLAFDTMRDLIRKLLSTQALVAMVGAESECAEPQGNDEAIGHLLGNHIQEMIDQIDEGGFLEDTTWPAAWNRLNKMQTLWVESALLDQAEAEDRLRDEVLPGMLEQLRRVAYQECRENHDPYLLADILSGGHLENHPFNGQQHVPLVAHFEDDDIITDMHLALTDLTIAAWDGDLPAEPIAGQSRRFGGGEEPGQAVTSAAAIAVPGNGSLVFGGDVWAFLCHSDSDGGSAAWDDNYLLVSVNGHILEDRDHGGNGRFFDQEKRYQMADILQAADLEAHLPHQLEITVDRTDVACDGHGPEERRLLQLTVNVTPVDLSLTGAWEVTVDGVCWGIVNIDQEGSQLTADGSIGGQVFCPFGSVAGEGSGSLEGQTINLGLAFNELGEVDFNGTVNATFTEMSGTYGGNYSGTWTAVRDD